MLEQLIRDRVAIANSAPEEGNPQGNLSGIAIWASVSEEVDVKIREQIKSGTFPVKLKAEDWNSGSINWLLDIIAPNQKLTTSVIANFKQVIKEGDIRMHLLISRLVDPQALKKNGRCPDRTGGNKAIDHYWFFPVQQGSQRAVNDLTEDDIRAHGSCVRTFANDALE